MAGPHNISYRPIRVVGLLLILQVVGLAGLGAYEFAQVDWQRVQLGTSLSQQAIEVLAFALFVPSVVMTLLSALSFLLLRRRGWLLAAIGQGLSLGVCLWLYSELQPWYVYPVMAYCVVMILYLNSQDVRTMFHPRRGPTKAKSRGGA
ncbi:MAG: hypothetical protein LC714_07180 [Actinobacteria bacterium]|nr:hypothetical protein [Actinomycetota bacterium]